jgi:hypothetical protein
MEALASFFAFGSVMYFLLTAGWVILLFYWVEQEFIFLSGFNVLLYMLFLEFIIKKGIFNDIAEQPIRFLLIMILYLICGFVWSLAKWWLFVNKEALQYKEKRYQWLIKQAEIRKGRVLVGGLDNITMETQVPHTLMEEWQRNIGYGYKKPKAVEHKKTISHWTLYWPISVLWSLLNDFVGKVMRVIIVKIRFIYDNITNKAFKNVENQEG